MPIPRQGDIVPLVTSPPPTTALPWRAMPAPVSANGHELLGGPGLADRGNGLGRR